MGLTLWGIEHTGEGGRPVVRVYIEAGDGVTVDNCAQVSRALSVALDVEDMIPGRYVLEVSSPGLERLFFDPAQMVPYVGQAVDVTLEEAHEGRRHFKGELESVRGEEFTLLTEDGLVTLSWNSTKKARLCFEPPQKDTGRKGRSK
jgi:ribosome maturation factor RimP